MERMPPREGPIGSFEHPGAIASPRAGGRSFGHWDAKRRQQLRALAAEHGLSVSAEELRRAVEDWRQHHGHTTAEEESGRLQPPEPEGQVLEHLLEADLLYAKLRQTLSSTAAVQRVFAGNRTLFEIIEAAAIAFDDRAEADALCRSLQAGETRFPIPAPENPLILPEAPTEGYLGLVTRADLPPEAAEALFADGAGEIVGPIRYGGRYWVYQILLPKQSELNERVYEYCGELLVQEALRAPAPDGGVIIPDAAGCTASRHGEP